MFSFLLCSNDSAEVGQDTVIPLDWVGCDLLPIQGRVPDDDKLDTLLLRVNEERFFLGRRRVTFGLVRYTIPSDDRVGFTALLPLLFLKVGLVIVKEGVCEIMLFVPFLLMSPEADRQNKRCFIRDLNDGICDESLSLAVL